MDILGVLKNDLSGQIVTKPLRLAIKIHRDKATVGKNHNMEFFQTEMALHQTTDKLEAHTFIRWNKVSMIPWFGPGIFLLFQMEIVKVFSLKPYIELQFTIFDNATTRQECMLCLMLMLNPLVRAQ